MNEKKLSKMEMPRASLLLVLEDSSDDDMLTPIPLMSPLERERERRLKQQRFEEAMLAEVEEEEERLDEEEKRECDENRKQEMDGLFDGMFDDEESLGMENEDENENENEPPTDRMTMAEVLRMHDVDSNHELYHFYGDTLSVQYAEDLVNLSPNVVGMPSAFKSTKYRIITSKLCNFVMLRVLNGLWDGDKAQEWRDIEANQIQLIYGRQMPVMSDTDNDTVSKP